jgi:adenylate kinase
MHHIEFDPPKKDGVCDKCGGELYQRDDDQETTIRSRLQNYHSQTSPLIEYYSTKGVVRKVDGTKSMEQVQSAITTAIGA